jgi:hypothetical protein
VPGVLTGEVAIANYTPPDAEVSVAWKKRLKRLLDLLK